MSDLISRKDVLHELDWCDYGLKDWQKWKLKMMVRDIPSTQPEIIMCKDCKYMTKHYDTDGNVPYWTCSEWDSGTDYDGFCHYAERRTG